MTNEECLVKTKKTKTGPRGTRVAKRTKKTWPSSAPGEPGFGDPINRKSLAAREMDAARAIARSWLAKAGFYEDPAGESPERVEIGFSDVGADGGRYVNVRVYVPALDIDRVVDGTHPDITAEVA